MSQVQILLIGVQPAIQTQFIDVIPDLEIHFCNDKAGLKSVMGQAANLDFQMILCGSEFHGMKILEIAQTLRMAFPAAKVFYAAALKAANDSNETINTKLFLKNGITQCFQIPLDQSSLKSTLEAALAEAEEQLYTPVRLVDIGAGTQLDFELRIFLSRNSRFVPYSGVGEVFDESRLERLKIYRVSSVFIPKKQLQKFYDFSASRLAVLNGTHSGIPNAERTEMLTSSVRELLNGMLSDAYVKHQNINKKAIEPTKHIIEEFLKLKYPGDWQQRFQAVAGEKNGVGFSHSISVSCYAVLFSMLLEQGDAQDLVIAALLHDLGLADLPSRFQSLSLETMTPAEHQLYQAHPERALRLIQSRGLSLSEGAIRGILHHHERWQGGGLPKGLHGRQVSIEGQILAVANRFEQLTRLDGGQTPLTPEQAMKTIAREGWMQPELIEPLKKIFEKETLQQIA